MRRWWIVLVLVVSGCSAGTGPAGLASTSPTPTSSPVASPPIAGPTALASATPSTAPAIKPSATLLFAALEAKGTTNPVGWNTVAIAGLDGYARAKATFIPMPVPYVGCANAVLPVSAQVAAGKVYFADGAGVIRALAPGGQPVEVTRFPLQSTQSMLSFAISPDGTQLLATIITLPPKPASAADPCASWASGQGSSIAQDVYAADNGSAARLLYSTTSSGRPDVMAFIGWDKVGPEGTYPTVWAVQGGGPHHYNGVPVRIDPNTGHVTGPVSIPELCAVEDIAASGDFVCVPAGTRDFTMRKPDGTELWHYSPPTNISYFLELISPDENHLLALGSTSAVIDRDGTAWGLATSFQASAWLDSQTLLGGGNGSNFAYFFRPAPLRDDIGFTGMFVGTVRN